MPYGRRCCRALVALVWLAGETLSMQGEGEEPATGGRSVLVLGAKIPTHGNGGWEAFEIDGRTFIAAANFWDGESVDMSALSKVYRVSLNETGKLLLKRHQSMRTRGAHGWDFFESGPGQTDHFHWKNSTFLIVAENFAQQISIYRIEGAEGSKSNRFPGLADHDKGLRRGGFGELTCVKEFGSFNNQYFLAFSEDRNEHTTQISSSVFRFDPGTESFRFLQSIPTDGAHGCELFTAQGSFLLAFANFGDRQGKRYKSKSSLWKYHEGDGIFRLIGEVKTQGATDVKHFTIEVTSSIPFFEFHSSNVANFNLQNHDFLAISNEGDIQNRRFQVSAIYSIRNINKSKDKL
ncbi:hypothetical protein GUITHDRAFT_112014 [Guillardia theta CCMP2712]|uniref:Phytase-like domain-containing protein n=1 Tax=Guillardia theta (strain CCMP2712) TaxID=905079 RepID=L1J0Q2_GUITC|nr:hypothetical protein GUITHDRAFT_112014 [Guillardia theta CCMP2712]EKX41872.1 hypothetical protein GUITHDRAFT_112014 [Guillardia theta CCMP2712]|eukprot:XP_005828852.1 hypothetical protein GUITHDRAFT_112014 [Guillardia theta CCMP2712]